MSKTSLPIVHLILAPAGHGKTTYAIDAVRALSPLSPARVLVPGQIQAAALKRRMAQAGGALGVQVQTFYGLYADVLALAGGAPKLPRPQPEQGMATLMPAIRQRLILHVAQTCHDAGRLSTYAPVRRSPGFARLLGNLFENALRHGDDTVIEVRARRDDRRVTITVADSGPGVPEDDLAHLFVPFFRSDRSRSRRTGGTGLGLMIVLRAVEAHGGKVTAANRPEGGLAVTFDLPAIES